MAYIPQTADDLGALQARVQAIADNLRNTRAEMVTDGPKVIGVDLATAVGYIKWLEDWGNKVAGRPKAERAMESANRERDRIASLRKNKSKKS